MRERHGYGGAPSTLFVMSFIRLAVLACPPATWLIQTCSNQKRVVGQNGAGLYIREFVSHDEQYDQLESMW